MEEDKKLYKKFLDGDKKAFESLVLKYKNNLIYFISRYVKNIDIAEDIFQDVMIFIFEKKDYYSFDYSFKTYLYMIAKSKALDFIKKDKTIESVEESKNDLEDTKLLEEIILTKEREDKIHSVIQKMSTEYQLVIYLTQIEGLSYKETALIMDKTENKIKALVFNARKKLKKLLVKENVIEIRNNKIIILLSMIIFVSAVITGATYAKEIREFIKGLFGANASDGVDTAVNNGFIAKPNVIEESADGIKVTVSDFMMDDYNFGMNFIIEFNNNYNIEEICKDKFLFEDLKITDENNNVIFSTNYDISEKDELNETEDFYYNGFSMKTNSIGDNKFEVSLITTGGVTPFPKSKKLKISFKRIAEELFPLSEEELINQDKRVFIGDWNFEVDVPKEMYERKLIIYKVKSCNDKNTIVENATLSNTAFKISIPVTTTDKIDYKALYDRENRKSIFSLIALQKEYVETSDGKRFETSNDGNSTGYSGASNQEKITDYKQTFNLTKYDATDELTVHIFTNKGEEIIIEFEKTK